ncbi:MAG TPA: hypothetical protein VKQ30_14790 [Ktedonobacterales bacterium]|nr:hypothetical protein [Ktedonobacterales bacterium]
MANAVPTTLRLLDPRLAALLRQTTDPVALYAFAGACARYALDATRLHDATLDEAVAHTRARTASTGADQLRQAVERLVARLDTAAFDAQDAFDAGKGPRAAYETAFAQARAATAALRCLDPNAMVAAAEACYEAVHATNDADALVRLAEQTLR